jgi:hypothetical protein
MQQSYRSIFVAIWDALCIIAREFACNVRWLLSRIRTDSRFLKYPLRALVANIKRDVTTALTKSHRVYAYTVGTPLVAVGFMFLLAVGFLINGRTGFKTVKSKLLGA